MMHCALLPNSSLIRSRHGKMPFITFFKNIYIYIMQFDCVDWSAFYDFVSGLPLQGEEKLCVIVFG